MLFFKITKIANNKFSNTECAFSVKTIIKATNSIVQKYLFGSEANVVYIFELVVFAFPDIYL